MAKAYTNQDYLKIALIYTDAILGTIVSTAIQYRKPNGVEGQWTAVHDEAQKTIYYILPLGEFLSMAGEWLFKSLVTFDDGRVLPSEPAAAKIYSPWK